MGWFSGLFGGGKKEEPMKVKAGMHREPQKPAAGAKMTKDPVCGMEVDMSKAAATSIYQGKTYYFCALGCKKSFDANPAKYISGKGEMKGGMHGHC